LQSHDVLAWRIKVKQNPYLSSSEMDVLLDIRQIEKKKKEIESKYKLIS